VPRLLGFFFTVFGKMNLWIITLPYIPSMWWLLIAIILLLLWAWCLKKRNAVGVYLEFAYEMMFDFFSDILWEHEYIWLRTYVTNMFFLIVIYNVLGLIIDFVSPVFGFSEELQLFHLAEYIGFGTSDYHFTAAMATVGVVIMLWVQFHMMAWDGMFWKSITKSKLAKPFWKSMNLMYEYLPIWWKNVVRMDRGTMNPFVYYPVWLIVKIFDIVISLFIWCLDIIGVFAKIVSLSFRLYGNMLSWTALLTVLVLWVSAGTESLLWFEFPILAPLILFAQGLLVSVIQAFIFPLLIAISIKVARMSWGEEQANTV
jgi:F0F1-type ATP synthase membrane subunit a